MKKGKNRIVLGLLVAAPAVIAALGQTAVAVAQAGGFTTDYSSLESAQKEAAKLGKDLAAEGDVLLKNDGSLPLVGNEWVSVFGVSSDAVEGGSQKLADVFEDAGFRVNPELKEYYAGVGTSYGTENVGQITKTAINSIDVYNDLGVVIVSRTGGESNDCATVINETEDNKYGSQDMGWTHNALKKDAETGKEYKHYLQLTDSEEELIELAKAHCKKVAVIINSSNVMELGNIQNDDQVNAILWIGRPGANGLEAVPEIFSGKINPSGKTVDIYPADLTKDVTWFSYGKGEQSTDENHPETYFRQADSDGSHIYQRTNPNMQAQIPGVSTGYSLAEYREDIYMGYRFYETADAEQKAGNFEGFDYAKDVVYPFGFGLSYTTFEFSNITSDAGANWAAQKTIKVSVDVKNTGSVAGKQVVQIYSHAPYTKGKVAKAEVSLVGYAKTDFLKPGQTQRVTVEVNVQDMASFDDRDKNGNGKATYELDAGAYELRVQTDSHTSVGKVDLTLAETAVLDHDDFSGAEVTALFSGRNEYNMLGWDPATSKTLEEEGKMVLLNRDNFKDTMPKPLTTEQLIRSDAWFTFHEAYDAFNADDQVDQATPSAFVTAFKEVEDGTSKLPWVKTASDVAGWSQAEKHEAGNTDVTIKFDEMIGIKRDDVTITEGRFAGQTGNQVWKAFMNQLTWDELVTMASNAGWGTPALESVGKNGTTDADGPNNLSSSYSWGDECHIASTWNTVIAKRQGTVMGDLAVFKNVTWYGPAMNTHRSPFGGRCNEYYSQDGYQGGAIGAAVIQGAQSRGVICYVKHCAMNDQEIYRMNLMTLATEQAARELYFKQFQMAIQEGATMALMTTYGSIGEISGATNYNFMTKLLREEWGFDGYAVTDAWMPCKDYWPLDMLVRAGCDAPLQNAGARTEKYETYLLSGKYDKASNTVKIGKNFTSTSYTQWYSVRKAAENVIYGQSKSNINKNSYDLSAFASKTLANGVQGQAYNANIAAPVSAQKVSYTLDSKSTLPAGLSLSSSGAISGTPSKPGTYKFTVNLVLDNWIKKSAEYTIVIDSAFKLDGNQSTNLKVGDEFDAYIESDYINTDKYSEVNYKVKSGEFPAGISMDGEGHIEGKATAAGVYNVTVQIDAVTVSQGKKGESRSTTSFEYELQFVVLDEAAGGDDVTTKNIVSVEETADGYVITFDDGSTITLKNGKDGKDGVDGQPGAPGADGKDGKDGEDGKDGADGAGCGGSIVAASGTLAAVAALGLAIAAKKKKEDK